MENSGNNPKRDLRSLLEGYSAKPSTAIQRKKDAQLTQYETGSGEGLEEIREALKKDPNNEKLQDWLAFSLYSNNEVDEAIELYMMLTADHKGIPTYHYYLGNCYAKKGVIQKAIEEWTAVVRIDPYSKMGRKAQARVEQAKALLRRVHPMAARGQRPPRPGGPRGPGGPGGPPRSGGTPQGPRGPTRPGSQAPPSQAPPSQAPPQAPGPRGPGPRGSGGPPGPGPHFPSRPGPRPPDSGNNQD